MCVRSPFGNNNISYTPEPERIHIKNQLTASREIKKRYSTLRWQEKRKKPALLKHKHTFSKFERRAEEQNVKKITNSNISIWMCSQKFYGVLAVLPSSLSSLFFRFSGISFSSCLQCCLLSATTSEYSLRACVCESASAVINLFSCSVRCYWN